MGANKILIPTKNVILALNTYNQASSWGAIAQIPSLKPKERSSDKSHHL
ncbi:MAG: hypothetical protein GDA56_18070 [Hormoscilla sp. GM7CHS1pb]|nr:hypothetical protein [Hormoscilla sp. GM7CHS1pb]